MMFKSIMHKFLRSGCGVGRRRFGGWTAILSFIFIYHIYKSYFRLPVDIIRYYELRNRAVLLKSAGTTKEVDVDEDGLMCKVPRLDPYDESILKYVSRPNPLRCKRVQWDLTYLDEAGLVRVNETELKLSGYGGHDLQCSGRCFDQNVGVDDDTAVYGQWVRFQDDLWLSIGCPFVEVSCVRGLLRLTVYSYHFMNISDDSSGNNTTAAARHPIITNNDDVRDPHTDSGGDKDDPPLSVVVFAIDSMSKSNMIRQMPSTYSYLVGDLAATVFDSHTKIGDNTWVNLLAMFSGLRSVPSAEFPADLSQEEDQFFDHYAPYIWRNFTRRGYRTFWSEDRPDIHTFNYGVRRGFQWRQFDYYDRPYWTATWASFVRKRSTGFCYNTSPEHKIQFDYLRRFLRTTTTSGAGEEEKKKFGILWWQALTHDFLNTIGLADADTRDFLESIRPYLNRTILIVLSDHGHRYDAIRESMIGRLEARLPFMAMVVPPWFRDRYPRAVENMRRNAKHRLTTQFDIYATLVEIMLKDHDDSTPGRANPSSSSSSVPPYAMSLFRPIPASRTCYQARIPEEYCPCYTELELPLSEPMVRRAASVLVDRVNQLLGGSQPPCAYLRLAEIVQSYASIPHQGTIRDAQVANRVASSGYYVMYRVVARTRPGGALLEGVVKHFLDTDSLTMDSDVERNNAYGNTSYCVRSNDLKKYCYCRHLD